MTTILFSLLSLIIGIVVGRAFPSAVDWALARLRSLRG